jgi:hypothetical protein
LIVRQEIRNIAIPGGVLVAAGVIAAISTSLPGAFAGSVVLAPLAVLFIGTCISLWFNRGRTFIAVASIFVGFVGYRIALAFGAGGFPVRAVFTALSIFVPLNILAALMLPERGVTISATTAGCCGNRPGTGDRWIAGAGRTALSGTRHAFSTTGLFVPSRPRLHGADGGRLHRGRDPRLAGTLPP